MPTNFDIITDRKDSNSYKWDSIADADILPMSIADMDFQTAPDIIDALQKRVQHGIFGYAPVPKTFYEAIKNWFFRQYHFSFETKYLLYTSGVVPAISAIIKAFSQSGDKILVQEPVYNCFFSSIRNNDCQFVSNYLDFEDFEKKAADPAVKIFLLCNPHNPVGRVWKRDEMLRLGEICKKNDVIVIADEIHCDLVFGENQFTPFASLSPDCNAISISCWAPSKTFNLAGLQVSCIYVSNEKWKQKIDKALNINEVCDISPFAIEALIAAYNKGDKWLKQLKNYLWENYIFLKNYFEQNISNLKVTDLEGTYLVWINCRNLGYSSTEICSKLMEISKLQLNSGDLYGEAGEGFIRMNIACPRSTLEEGLKRLQKAIEIIQNP
ncbi:MAG TPA: cystathionine beta-lyase [Flavobacteriaceae bacterium]|nr:cystathionine beta-lyase [Flavobacteriaceae bacterium]